MTEFRKDSLGMAFMALRATISADFKATGLHFSRALFNTAFRAVLSYRIYSFIYTRISRALGYVMYQRAIRKYGVDIAPTARIGPGFLISHVGAVVVGRNTVLGAQTTINSCVTFGMRNSNDEAMPLCGDYLNVGSGAKILGGVNIGYNVVIGANAVVLDDSPSMAVLVGAPARNINKECSNDQRVDLLGKE